MTSRIKQNIFGGGGLVGDAHCFPNMRRASGAAASVAMMASSAARCSSRWITVAVSSGQRRAVSAIVCSGHGEFRSFSTLRAEKLWRDGSPVCGGVGKAVTLRGLSGKSCVSHMVVALARLG